MNLDNRELQVPVWQFIGVTGRQWFDPQEKLHHSSCLSRGHWLRRCREHSASTDPVPGKDTQLSMIVVVKTSACLLEAANHT